MPRVPTYVYALLIAIGVAMLAFSAFGHDLFPAVVQALPRVYLCAGVVIVMLAFNRPLAKVTTEETPVGSITSFDLGRGARRLLVGLVLILTAGLAGCASADAAREAYCAGVTAGGRAALAELATGRPDPLIACDPTPAAPVVVIIHPADQAPRPAPVPVLAEPVDPLI